MALLERLEIVIEADARTAEREFDRIGRQASESLESIETAAGEVGDNASKKLAGAAPEFARAGEKLSDAAGKELDLSAAASEAAADVSRALESQRQEAGQSGRRLGDSAGRGVAEGVRDSGSQVRAAGADAGAAAGDGVSDGLLGSLGDLAGGLGGAMDDALGALPAGLAGPVAAAGALIGAGLVNGISDAIQTENLGDVIAARVGEGAAESERFARVTSEVFRDAWGESTAEVADAVDLVYSTLEDSRRSEAALSRLTEKAQAMADVFGVDVQQAVQAAGQLVFNGLADDADEAFDFIIAGMQDVSAATRDELLDAIAEYGNDFADIGIDGARAMDILAAASDGGSMALDNAGDSVKELSVRVANLGDVTAQSALSDLGLDAELMAGQMAQGGEAADLATQQIAEALLRVENPAERYRIAVDLMGGPVENLGRELLPDFLEAMAGSGDAMTNAAGASDRLTDSLQNTQSSITTFKRTILGSFEDLAESILDPIVEVLRDPDPSIADYAQAFGESLVGDIEQGVRETPKESFFDAIGGGLEDWLNENAAGIDWDGVFDNNAEDEATDAARELGLEVGNALAEGTVDGARGAGEAVQGAVARLVGVDAGPAARSLEDLNAEIELSAELFELAAQRGEFYLTAIAESSNLDDAISAQLELRDAAAQLADGLGALQGVDIEAFADGTIQVSDEAADALGDIAGAASAAQQQIANALEFEGEEAALETAAQIRDRFIGLFQAAGLSNDQIEDLLRSMGLLDDQVEIAIQLSGNEEAMAKLEILRAFLTNEGGSGIPPAINAQIEVALAEDRAQDAANLLSIFIEDQQDGLIENPLLIALGLGDTAPASGEVEAWKRDEEGKRPAWVPVDGNTEPARGAVGRLMQDILSLRPTIQVGANVTAATNAIAQAGIAGAELRANRDINGNGIIGRAVGGRTLAGATYEINERGTELVTMDDGGFVVNASNFRELLDLMRGIAASGGGQPIQIGPVVSPDPVVTASETARKLRDASYLVGA